MENRRARKRILLVDDEREVRSATRMLLEVYGYEVAEAENGVKALALFEEAVFDLVITDFRMDRMNGGELARRIKQNSPSMPVIMITGYHDEVPPGVVDALIDKPFPWEELRAAIERLLKRATVDGRKGQGGATSASQG